jgi:hypothetical protein
MTTEIIYAVLSITATLLSCITAIFAILAYCKVVGMEKSTHRIQYMSPKDMGGPTGKDLANKMAGLNDDEF